MTKEPKLLYPRQAGKNITYTGTFQVEDKENLEKIFEDMIIDAYGIILANPKDEDKLQEYLKQLNKKEVLVIKHNYIEPGKFYAITEKKHKKALLIQHGILKI